ncbi:hypothetical protein K439DRAFT_1367039, partial [Ramaria rubella]
LATAIIFLCIDDSQKDHVHDCRNNPEAMWDRLKELHQQRKAGPRFSAYDVLFSIRKKENESLIEYTGHVSRAMAHIKSLHPSHFGLQQLDEELQSMALIHGLSPDCTSFINSLFLLDKLTLASLCAALHNHENQAALRDTSTPTVALKTFVNPTVLTSTCNWCSCTGHVEDNCYSKK